MPQLYMEEVKIMNSCYSSNKVMEEIYNHDLEAVGGKLKELLGHTPLEVWVGAAYGLVFAYCYHLYIVG